MNETVLRKKRSDFESREAASEVRRREMEEIRKRDEERKHQEDIRKEKERQEKYAAAVEAEEMRKLRIKTHAEEKDRMLAELYQKRKKENDIKKAEAEFEMKLRLDKVCYTSIQNIMTFAFSTSRLRNSFFIAVHDQTF